MRLLVFGAKWCPGCRIMEPRVEEIQNEIPELEVETVDAEERKELAEKYGVAELPTFVFVDKEEGELDKLTGIIPKDKILELAIKNKDK